MDQQSKHELKRSAATAFLQDLLQRYAGRPDEDIAEAITSLALEDGNPVREFFAQAGGSPSPTSPTRSSKSRGSSKVLARFVPKNLAPEGKTPTPSQQGGDRSKQGPSSVTSKATTVRKQSDPSPSALSMPYKCIICNEDMSYKGVCKRHLDEQHVSPNIFQCERCGQCFGTKADAKVHCNRYENGRCHWNVVKPAPKVLYVSEYTDEWFTSKTTYLEHLLKLSKHGSLRPQPSLHRKLRTLLGHPSLREHSQDMAEIVTGLKESWKKLRYSDTQLRRAIRQLEDAAIADAAGTITFDGGVDATNHALDIRHFLHTLFSAGKLPEEASAEGLSHPRQPQSVSSIGDRRTSISTTIRRGPSPIVMNTYFAAQGNAIGDASQGSIVPMNYGAGSAAARTPRELRVKRRVSDLSNSTEPLRQPPGPPPVPAAFQFNPNAPGQPVQDGAFLQLLPTTLADKPPDGSAFVQQPPIINPNAPPSAFVPALEGSNASITSSNFSQQDLQPASTLGNEMWPPQNPNFHFEFKDSENRALTAPEFYPSDTSTRTSSIDTDRTTYMDSSEDEMAGYQPFHQYAPGVLGTFLMDEDADYSEMPMLYQQMSGL